MAEKTTTSTRPKPIKVKLLANIKYNSTRYKKGEEIEIKKEDYDSFVKGGLINEG